MMRYTSRLKEDQWRFTRKGEGDENIILPRHSCAMRYYGQQAYKIQVL